MGTIDSPLLRLFPQAKLIRLTGYRNNDLYNRAKVPIESWKEVGLAIDDAVRWIAVGGWLGFVIPDRYILIDVDDKEMGEALHNGFQSNGIQSISIETPRGYQFLFRDTGKVTTQAAKMLTISGLAVDYRLAGKGYAVLPTEGMPDRRVIYSPDTVDGLNDMPMMFIPLRRIKGGEQSIAIPILEGARNDNLFKAACLVRTSNIQYHLNLTEADRKHLLHEMNVFLCNPPLDIREVETIFRSTESYEVPSLPTITEAAPYPMRPVALRQLYDEPDEEVSWLVEGILIAGGFSVIGSRPKVGKSTLARNLCLYVAKGTDFLGRPVKRGPVIYYALEEIGSEVKRHFQDMGASGDENIHVYVGGSSRDALKEIRKAIEEIEPVLVVIDPLFRLVQVKDGNDYVQVTQALDPVLRIARDTGVHVVCVHHTTKSASQDNDSLLGSTAIFGSVDTTIIMKRTENYRSVRTTQRYGEDMPETILGFDETTRTIFLGHSREEEDLEAAEQSIHDYLSGQPSPVPEVQILDDVTGKRGDKVKGLRKMVEKGVVSRTGKGGKSDPYKYSCIVVPHIYEKTRIQETDTHRMSSPEAS